MLHITIAVIVVVVLSGLGVIAGGRRRHAPDPVPGLLRPELPKARRQRQIRERDRTIQGRKQLIGLRDLTDRLLMAATSTAQDDEPLELLVGTVDGQPRAYALPPSDDDS